MATMVWNCASSLTSSISGICLNFNHHYFLRLISRFRIRALAWFAWEVAPFFTLRVLRSESEIWIPLCEWLMLRPVWARQPFESLEIASKLVMEGRTLKYGLQSLS